MEDKDNVNKPCKILELPDCVLSILLSYLDSTSLFFLTRTCRYFKQFIEDPIFWKYIDARSEPNFDEKVQYCCDRIYEKTTHVFFRAQYRHYGEIPTNFIEMINPFVNLRVLALENQRFNGYKLTLKNFPSHLEELSLKKSYIKGSHNFFKLTAENMQNLRVLILDECQWLTCTFLVSVAKYKNLEIISAVKCLRLHLDMIPYLSVARNGCKKLKIFDCRFTGIGHELLSSFYAKEQIQTLYFQGIKSATLDYHTEISPESYGFMKVPFIDENNLDRNVCDASLVKYSDLFASDILDDMPNSILYKDPYPKCTCSYTRNEQSGTVQDVNRPDFYLKILDNDCTFVPRISQAMPFVCSKHINDIQKLPEGFQHFFMSNQRQFDSDITSDDNDSDSSDPSEDMACCIYGMGTRMIIVPSLQHQREAVDYNIERNQGRINVSIYNVENPFEECRNEIRQDSNASPSTSRGLSQNVNNKKPQNENKRRYSREDEAYTEQNKRTKIINSDSRNAVNDRQIQIQVNSIANSTTGTEDAPSTSRSANHKMRKKEHDEGKSNLQIKFNNKSNLITGTKINSSSYKFNSDEPSCSTQNGDGLNNQCHKNSSDKNEDDLKMEENHDIALSNSNGNNQREPNVQRASAKNRKRILVINTNYHQAHDDNNRKKSALKRLSLRGYKYISDVALSCIQNLNIDLLDLTYTGVTKQGIEKFLVHNPNCRVIHPSYCICKPLKPF